MCVFAASLYLNTAILTLGLDKTGPETATTAILIIYDIFGFSPQVLQVPSPLPLRRDPLLTAVSTTGR